MLQQHQPQPQQQQQQQQQMQMHDGHEAVLLRASRRQQIEGGGYRVPAQQTNRSTTVGHSTAKRHPQSKVQEHLSLKTPQAAPDGEGVSTRQAQSEAAQRNYSSVSASASAKVPAKVSPEGAARRSSQLQRQQQQYQSSHDGNGEV